jgi:hypothetical protein
VEIETFNKFGVALAGKSVAILLPASLVGPIAPADAVLLAVYLVIMAEIADHTVTKFEDVRKAVEAT